MHVSSDPPLQSWQLLSPKLPCGLCFISCWLPDPLSTSLLCCPLLSTPTKVQRSKLNFLFLSKDPVCVLRWTPASTCLFLALVITKSRSRNPADRTLTLSPYFSPALQPVARLSDVGRIIAAAVCLAAQRYAAEQPEVHPPWQRGVRTDKGEEAEASSPGFITSAFVFMVQLLLLSSPLQSGASSVKQRSASVSQTADKHPEDPRTIQQRRSRTSQTPQISVRVVFTNPLVSVSSSQEIPCSGSNASGAVLPHLPSSSSGQPQADAPSSFTPTLAAHFDENLVRHIQGWPSETTEKQVRLLPLVLLPSAVALYLTGETTSLKWSPPSFLTFPVFLLVLASIGT